MHPLYKKIEVRSIAPSLARSSRIVLFIPERLRAEWSIYLLCNSGATVR